MKAVQVPRARFRALVTGEVVTLPDASGLDVGTDVELHDGGHDQGPLKRAYRRWADRPVTGAWTAHVEAIVDADSLDPRAFAARHVLARHPQGPIAMLRVSGPDGVVLSDVAFAARLRSAS